MPASTGNARLTGLIGDPVSHSLSPLIHEYWLDRAGIDGCYLPFRQSAADLPALLAGLRGLDIAGFNITVPYKQAILPYLDRLDLHAASIGAVNTVVVDGQGRWIGYNTDGKGFLHSLEGSIPPAGDMNAVLLGAGGAARAITHALLETGRFKLTLTNRDEGKTQKLAQELMARYDVAVTIIPWEQRLSPLPGSDLLINSTTLGMAGMPALDLPLDALPASTIVADIVYAPLETPLLLEARKRGLKTVDGLGMLLGQAAAAFELWHGIAPAIDAPLRQKLMAAREPASR